MQSPSTSLLGPQTRERVAKLIPLLGSPVDGEVVATSSAIGRALSGNGHDWHDLAKTVGEPCSESPKPRENFDVEGMVDFLLRDCPLSARQRDFVSSLYRQYRSRGGLSPKQWRALRDIYHRWMGCAA